MADPSSLARTAAPTETLSQAACARWHERHGGALRSYLARSLGRERQSADDLLHEVFVRALGATAPLPPDDEARAWLFRIATNLLIDQHRQRARRHPVGPPAECLASRDAGPEEQAMRDEMRRRLRDAVARLPDEQRQVYLLREHEQVPFREIALQTGAPLGTVLARMRLAMLRLAGELTEGGRPQARGAAPRGKSAASGPGDRSVRDGEDPRRSDIAGPRSSAKRLAWALPSLGAVGGKQWGKP